MAADQAATGRQVARAKACDDYVPLDRASDEGVTRMGTPCFNCGLELSNHNWTSQETFYDDREFSARRDYVIKSTATGGSQWLLEWVRVVPT